LVPESPRLYLLVVLASLLEEGVSFGHTLGTVEERTPAPDGPPI